MSAHTSALSGHVLKATPCTTALPYLRMVNPRDLSQESPKEGRIAAGLGVAWTNIVKL